MSWDDVDKPRASVGAVGAVGFAATGCALLAKYPFGLVVQIGCGVILLTASAAIFVILALVIATGD